MSGARWQCPRALPAGPNPEPQLAKWLSDPQYLHLLRLCQPQPSDAVEKHFPLFPCLASSSDFGELEVGKGRWKAQGLLAYRAFRGRMSNSGRSRMVKVARGEEPTF